MVNINTIIFFVPQSGEEDYLLADITSAQDWGIRNELDAAEAMYNGSVSINNSVFK